MEVRASQDKNRRKQSESGPRNTLKMALHMTNQSHPSISPRNSSRSNKGVARSLPASKPSVATAGTIANLERRQKAYNKT